LVRFFRFDSVFSQFFSVWVRFGFFGFRLMKPNRTGWFFQNFNRFNRFFFTIRFFQLFFSGFLGLIGFSVFFSPLLLTHYFNLLKAREKMLNFLHVINWAIIVIVVFEV
jgi:hypothetical protein